MKETYQRQEAARQVEGLCSHDFQRGREDEKEYVSCIMLLASKLKVVVGKQSLKLG